MILNLSPLIPHQISPVVVFHFVYKCSRHTCTHCMCVHADVAVRVNVSLPIRLCLFVCLFVSIASSGRLAGLLCQSANDNFVPKILIECC